MNETPLPIDAYTVHELNSMLSTSIGSITPQPIAITGTLTTWTRSKAWQRGELVTHNDKSISAKLTVGCTARKGVVMSRQIAQTGTTLTPPINLTMTGTLEFHEQYGLRFHINSIDPASIATADTQVDKDDLIALLKAQSLFDQQRTLRPPQQIDRIGLITPEAGDAARQDALDVLLPLNKEIQELRIPTGNAVGHTAIAKAIDNLAPRSDIIMIVRGGGASSDLHVWDHQTVANAIASCRTPIVVGVGHATDNHIARQVAWHGANTPTAAARHIADIIAPTVVAPVTVPATVTIPEPQTTTAPLVTPRMRTLAERRRRRATRLALLVLVAVAIAVAYWIGANG